MRLSCVNIATVNQIKMKDFYSLVLNAPCYERNPYRYEINVDNVQIVITHTETKTPVNPDCCGLEFYVDDVDAEYTRLLDAGIRTENPPETLPWNCRYFAVKDPDGNNLDFVQIMDDGQQA
ncbi:MAG: VOC family protein [Clostridiales bacterium]|nr:VOC family protein [Clostridiales bacterium]